MTLTRRSRGGERAGSLEGTTPAPTQGRVAELFRAAEEARIPYAVLRAHPDVGAPNGEIDVLVPPAFLRALLRQVRLVCRRHGGMRIAYWRELPHHAATVILAWRTAGFGWRHHLLDIRCGIHKKGRLLLDGRDLGTDSTVWDPELELRRLADGLECALLMVRNALDERVETERHRWIFTHRWRDDVPEQVRRMGFDYEALEAGRAKRATRWGMAHRLRRVRYGARALFGRLAGWSAGLNVVFYGPDGVGKTTQAELVARFFSVSGQGRIPVRTYHAFAETKKLSKHRAGALASVKRRTYRVTRGRLARVAALSAAYLKRLAILWTRLLPEVRRGGILIHDRYLLDVFTKFLKAHGIRARGLERLGGKLSPPRDIVFLLRADPEVVSSRTGELQVGEVAEVYELLDRCLEGVRASPAVSEVDANREIEAVHDAVVERILDVQTERCLGAATRDR